GFKRHESFPILDGASLGNGDRTSRKISAIMTLRSRKHSGFVPEMPSRPRCRLVLQSPPQCQQRLRAVGGGCKLQLPCAAICGFICPRQGTVHLLTYSPTRTAARS